MTSSNLTEIFSNAAEAPTQEVMTEEVIVTKEGDPLPDIMEPVTEDPEARKIRRRSTDEVAIDLNSTYTFSFHDMRLDLLQWKILR